MRVVVCDDHTEDRNLLIEQIKKYCILNNLHVDIIEFCNGGDLLSDYKLNYANIIFLDIYMDDIDEINGVEIAKKIREIDTDSIIIFTTNSTDHALDAFSVHALDYLVKPISFDKLSTSLNRCFSLISQPTKYIEVSSNRLLIKIVLNSILYIEVFNKYCLIHTTSDTIKTYMSLSQIESKLDLKVFIRCHRSYIVNMDHIKTFTQNDFILSNDCVVPIVKDKKINIKQLYADYLFEKSRM